VAAVGDHRVAGGDLQRRQLRGAERGGEVARQFIPAEAETFHIGQRLVDADVPHQADGHQVARAIEGFAQADRAEEVATGVAWAPVITLRTIAEDQGRIVDQAGRGVAMIQRRAVEERLERGAGLTARLGYPVVVALDKGEAAGQCLDGAGLRGQHHPGALRLGDLRQLVLVLLIQRLYPDQVAALQYVSGLARVRSHAVGAQVGARPAHGFPTDGAALAVAQYHADRLRAHLADNGGPQAAHAALGPQQLLPLLRRGLRVARLRAAVAVALVIGHQPGAQGLVGQRLQFAVDRGIYVVTVDIGVGTEALEHVQR